jgi:hypothetical protein
MTYQLNLTEFQLVEIQHALHTVQSQYKQMIETNDPNTGMDYDRLKEEVQEIDEIFVLINNITNTWVYGE